MSASAWETWSLRILRTIKLRLPSYLMFPSRSSSVPVNLKIWSTSLSLKRSPGTVNNTQVCLKYLCNERRPNLVNIVIIANCHPQYKLTLQMRFQRLRPNCGCQVPQWHWSIIPDLSESQTSKMVAANPLLCHWGAGAQNIGVAVVVEITLLSHPHTSMFTMLKHWSRLPSGNISIWHQWVGHVQRYSV